jgi:hypothetical protein
MFIQRFYSDHPDVNDEAAPCVTAKAMVDTELFDVPVWEKAAQVAPIVHAVQDLYSRDLISCDQMADWTRQICNRYELRAGYFEPTHNLCGMLEIFPFTLDKSSYRRFPD